MSIAGYVTAPPMDFSVREPDGLTIFWFSSSNFKIKSKTGWLKMTGLTRISGHIFPFGSVMKPASLLNPQVNLCSGSATSN